MHYFAVFNKSKKIIANTYPNVIKSRLTAIS